MKDGNINFLKKQWFNIFAFIFFIVFGTVQVQLGRDGMDYVIATLDYILAITYAINIYLDYKNKDK